MVSLRRSGCPRPVSNAATFRYRSVPLDLRYSGRRDARASRTVTVDRFPTASLHAGDDWRTARRVVLVEQALDRASLTAGERDAGAAERQLEHGRVARIGGDERVEVVLAVRRERLAADLGVEVRARLDGRVLVDVLETPCSLGS